MMGLRRVTPDPGPPVPLERAADFLDNFVYRHYHETFSGVRALPRDRRLVLDATDREAATRWLAAFGRDFCGWPLGLSPPEEAH